MFSILDHSVSSRHGVRLCDGVNRRELLRVGGLGACGLSLPSLLNAAADPSAAPSTGSFGRAKRCIVLFLLGGPPQHETWDPKPDAPSEVRGEFSPIDSATPGLRVGELMPQTAKLTDRIGVLRAVSTADNAHSSSGYWMLTGHPHAPPNQENALHGPPNDWPCVGAVVRHLRGDSASLPGAVRLPEEIWNTGHIVWPGQDAGWLGNNADPWLLTCDPNKPDFKIPDLSLPGDIPALRFDRRRSLLASVNQHLDSVNRDRVVERWSGLQTKAFDLLSSSDARRAFDIQAEPDAVRERYGRNRFGQSVLLARRLVEAGVSLVQVNWTRWEEDSTGRRLGIITRTTPSDSRRCSCRPWIRLTRRCWKIWNNAACWKIRWSSGLASLGVLPRSTLAGVEIIGGMCFPLPWREAASRWHGAWSFRFARRFSRIGTSRATRHHGHDFSLSRLSCPHRNSRPAGPPHGDQQRQPHQLDPAIVNSFSFR